MSRAITFSRVFPKTHPRAGDPTHFVEKIWASISEDFSKTIIGLDQELMNIVHGEYHPKSHTIRAGIRWKVGDRFSPRVWSGRPYASKQIVISPDIEIKKIWNIEINSLNCIWINGKIFSEFKYSNKVANLAKNDGLSVDDFWSWFDVNIGKVFTGQIISWSSDINY